MKRFLFASVGLLLLGLSIPLHADNDKEPKKRLLLITESRGYRHGCVARKVTTSITVAGKPVTNLDGWELSVGKDGKLQASYNGLAKTVEVEIKTKVEPCVVEKTFAELAAKHNFEVVASQNSRKEITAENLKNFDAVFFYTTGSLPLSEVQKSDLLAFVRSGKGFGGSHCATDTFYDWKEYGELIGGYFDGHPWHQKIKVIVEDKNNPATKHLGESFEITDEIYQFKGPYSRDRLRVLMRLDMGSVKDQGRRKDGDNALAWIHRFGEGRVFYTALGHRDEVWADPRFQQHIIGGLRYMFGQEQADTTPSAKDK